MTKANDEAQEALQNLNDAKADVSRHTQEAADFRKAAAEYREQHRDRTTAAQDALDESRKQQLLHAAAQTKGDNAAAELKSAKAEKEQAETDAKKAAENLER